MEKHNAAEAERMLSELNLFTFEHMEKDGREQFINGLKRAAGYDNGSDNDSLDKSGLAKLRGKIGK